MIEVKWESSKEGMLLWIRYSFQGISVAVPLRLGEISNLLRYLGCLPTGVVIPTSDTEWQKIS